MQRELTISLSEETYNGLMKLVGANNADQFIEAVLHSCLENPLEEYEVKLPLNNGRKIVYIRSPRLANHSSVDELKIEMIEENANA